MASLTKIIGNFVNNVTGKTASNEFAAEEAQKQRDWEKEMSETAYQRATNDMKAAGLNPSAMYGGTAGAASTPSGASASANGGTTGILNGIAAMIHSAGTMAKTMNAKNEQKAKLEAYEKANDMLRTASHLAARMITKKHAS